MKGREKTVQDRNAFISVIALLCISLALPINAGAETSNLVARYGQIPLYFTKNEGQLDERVKYFERGNGHITYFARDGVYLQWIDPPQNVKEPAGPVEALLSEGGVPPLQTLTKEGPVSRTVRLKFIGSNENPQITGNQELAGKVNYFIGSDPKKWATNLPTYQAVSYKELYPGIDAAFYGKGGQLEYDIIVKPGADPNDVRFTYEGAKSLKISEEGDLILAHGETEIVQKKPYVYQDIQGKRIELEGRFKVYDSHSMTFGFEVSAYNKDFPLIIDPVLEYSTYLGGTSLDNGTSIAVDAGGNTYIVGTTVSRDFPTSNAIYPITQDNQYYDAFVTKFNAAGTAIIYSTYLTGNGWDLGHGIAVDGEGNAYIVGETSSSNFPIKNHFQGYNGGYGYDAFVTKINPDGSELVYSTYLGGGSSDAAFGIAVDASGSAYIIGGTGDCGRINNFPVVNPIQANERGCGDIFVTKFTPEGSSLVFSTYLGGSVGEAGLGIALDKMNNICVTGWTWSPDFPTKNPLQLYTPRSSSRFLGADIFVAKLNVEEASLIFSTFLGGSGEDYADAIAVDNTGDIYISGTTSSTNLLTINAFQPVFGGGETDAFITKIKSDGSGLIYSTYLGGTDYDGGGWHYGFFSHNLAGAIAVDHLGYAYVTGQTFSQTDFPLADPIQPVHGGEGRHQDIFISKIKPDGSALAFSTYFGGKNLDVGSDIAVDTMGNIYVTGITASSNFPLKNPYQPTLRYYDAFALKISQQREPLLPNVRVIDTISTVNIDLDSTSFSTPPTSITVASDQTLIEWQFNSFSIGQIEDLSFDVILKNPFPGEDRLVNHKLELLYTDVNGNPVRTELGPQFVHVLSTAVNLDVATDRTVYTVGETVLSDLTLSNQSDFSKTVDANVSVTDATGVAVGPIGSFTGVTLAPGETRTFAALPFETLGLFAGPFQVVGVLFDGGQEAQDRQEITLDALPSSLGLDSSITTDKQSYPANATATLHSVAANLDSSKNYTDLIVTVQISGLAGEEVERFTRTIPTLLSLSRSDANLFFLTGLHPPGLYTVYQRVLDNGTVLGTATASFTIEPSFDPDVGLIGSLVAEPTFLLGTTETLTSSVTSVGNVPLSNVTFSWLIIDAEVGSVLRQFSLTRDVAQGEQFSHVTVFPDLMLAPKTYLALLQATITDQTATLAHDNFTVVNQPPDCSQAAADPDLLWPPNHKLVPISILGVTDPDGDPVSLTIRQITQDEPVNGLGDGDTGPDGVGVGTSEAHVRSERVGKGNGRVYAIGFDAADGRGGLCSGAVSVGVPHDQGQGNVPIDDGQSYDATLP